MAAKTLSLPLGSVISIDVLGDGTYVDLSEHNRSPISLTINRIENVNRMANGTMRKYFVAEKRSISVSWEMLPSFSNLTVDGKYGAIDIKDFYSSSIGRSSFKVKLKYGKSKSSSLIDRYENNGYLEMMFNSECTFELIKRNVKDRDSDPAQELWNVSLSMVEV
jgi:hypothetical protein